MSEQWYMILHDKESCDTVMKIFHSFHDYMITRFDYDYPNCTLSVYFKYDSEEEGAVLKFIDVEKLNIVPLVDPGVPWMSDSFLQITKDNTFLWYVDDVEYPDDEIMNSHDLIWIESDEIHFAFLDKKGEIAPLTDIKLNPTWHIYNFDTHKYEEVENHFKVYKV